MIVSENGKTYNIDEESGLVTEASVEDLAEEFRIGNRVEVAGQLGEVVSLTPSVYGPAFGVRFDDGDVAEFAEAQLKHSSVAPPDYESPVEEVLQRFAVYKELPALTNEQISHKEAEARWLNLRAKSLVTDQKLAFSDQNDLSTIVLVTGTDLVEIKELRSKLDENVEYLGKFNRYKIAGEVSGYGASLGMTGDASWLDNAVEDMEVVETTDTDLAARATEVVAALSKEQLEDDEFLKAAASYQQEYLQMDKDQALKFDSYLARARDEKLSEPQPKVASTEKNWDEIDDAAIFFG
jgi:hypothetical protein